MTTKRKRALRAQWEEGYEFAREELQAAYDRGKAAGEIGQPPVSGLYPDLTSEPYLRIDELADFKDHVYLAGHVAGKAALAKKVDLFYNEVVTLMIDRGILH